MHLDHGKAGGMHIQLKESRGEENRGAQWIILNVQQPRWRERVTYTNEVPVFVRKAEKKETCGGYGCA